MSIFIKSKVVFKMFTEGLVYLFFTVCISLFLYHATKGAYSKVKKFFIPKETIHVITDLKKNDQMVLFIEKYLETNKLSNKYQHKVVSIKECKIDTICMDSGGVFVTKNHMLIKDSSLGFAEFDAAIYDALQGIGIEMLGETILKINTKDMPYYYGVTFKNRYRILLQGIPITFANVLYGKRD